MKHMWVALVATVATASFAAADVAVLRQWQAEAAYVDEFSQFEGGHAFWFANALVPGGGRQYGFANSSGRLVELDTNGDGQTDELRLTGQIVSLTSSDHAFDVSVALVSSVPGAGSPTRELKDAAYSQDGGPINTMDWSYYRVDAARATLTGVGAATAGTTIGLFTYPQDFSMPFQMGYGASGKNVDFGMGGWFGFNKNGQNYRGDVNIALTSVVPIPGALMMGGLGLSALVGLRRRL